MVDLFFLSHGNGITDGCCQQHNPSPRGAPTQELSDFFRSTAPDGRPIAHQSRSIPSSPRVTGPSPPTPAWGDYRQGDSHATPSLSDYLKHAAPPGSPGRAAQNGSKLQKMMPSGAAPSISTLHISSSRSDTTGLPAVIRHQTLSETPGRSKHRLLARDASGSTGSDTTSALADFFRNTTPPAVDDGGEQPAAHRISRAVAPFRNTMDSTQFESLGDDDAIDEAGREHSSKAPTSVASVPQDSYSSSFSSSTALLRSSSRKAKDCGSGSTTTVATSSALTLAVKRTQFRSKDPYAIERLDDDDGEDGGDMEGLNLVIPKKRDEESLVDFLRNTPPPPPPPTAPQPFVQSNGKTIQKKGSAVSLMSRFGRSGRKNSVASNTDKTPFIPPPAASSQASRHVPLKVPNASDARTGRTSSGSDQYPRPSYGQARADFDNQFGVSSIFPAARPPRPLVLARGARAGRNDTDSLADFLKHTGPPPEARVSQPQKEESRSLLQKISFSRHKKFGVS